ncbi:MAG: pantoate--beta-alanine ligase, partial [Flavitalea sp.]
MIIFRQADSLRRYLDLQRSNKTSIGFVPTMGALHAGHLALLMESKKQSGITVCSIFVNPTQFNDRKDFDKYPVTIEQDIQQIESIATEILFLPAVDDIYPDGTEKLENYQLGYLETVLEGKFRPGHFQGVSQVMKRLLHIVSPDTLFMGQKDFQQSLVVGHLLQNLNTKTELVVVTTVRENNGLAMSSRNMRLTEIERANAGAICQSLEYIRKHISAGNLTDLKKNASNILLAHGFKIDYVEIADRDTL